MTRTDRAIGRRASWRFTVAEALAVCAALGVMLSGIYVALGPGSSVTPRVEARQAGASSIR